MSSRSLNKASTEQGGYVLRLLSHGVRATKKTNTGGLSVFATKASTS